MQLQAITNCAVWLMAYLSCNNGLVPTRELVAELGFTKSNIISAASTLKENGYITSDNGPFGGYTIRKAPESITIQEILMLFDDNVHLIDAKTPHKFGRAPIESVKELMRQAESSVEQIMGSRTLAELCKRK